MSREEVQEMVRKKREEYAAKFAAGEVTAPVFSRIKRRKTAARACKKYVPVNGDTELVARDPDMDAEDTAAWSDDTANDDNFVPISPPSDFVDGDIVSSADEAKYFFGLSSCSDDGDTAPTHAILKRAQYEIPQTRMTEKAAGTNTARGLIQSDSCELFLSGFPSRWLSWERFHEALKEFSAKTKQRFIVRSTSSIKKRNKQITSGARKIPAFWKQYCKTLVCTHGLEQRPRGTGARQRQSVRYTGCSAKINTRLTRTDREYYIYARASGEHNHALTDELWDYYAENRTIHDPALLSTVGDMRSAGSSSKGILAWLRKKSGKKTKLKDVHNIFQELKHSAKGDTSDAERTESILQEFANQLDGNTARIFVDKTRDVAVAVVFQTEGMRRLFAAFPEVVMVDTTHDTNANAYKLFSFVVHDCFGKGQYVQHALVERETKDILRLVVNVFKDDNPAYSNVKVVMTDKAFHEKDVLAEVFKQARQLLCQFHVQQWFAKQVGRLMRGSTDEKALVEASMAQLIYARSASEYDEQKALLLDLLGGNDNHPLYNTFIENWDGMTEEWVAYRRGNIPHLRNNTNNRLESKWGKIKQLVNSDYAIDELVSALIMMQEWAEDEYIEEYNKIGSRPPIAEHPELSALAVTVTKYAFDLVTGEFKYATTGDVHYQMTRNGHQVVLLSSRAAISHTVDTKVCALACGSAWRFLLCGMSNCVPLSHTYIWL
ncbi:hypothetical protein PR001_g26506 [Phytophthora rubi]|uniref:ZSWIM1/3 RNaseH-like domain-containing protein n=1 Tax=Phytophthora rubi TaxID=129364 RepID=A0A6A3HY70_9STRA|nr:hypothetical protein PR001_g26506 [Phytophthora rubi]